MMLKRLGPYKIERLLGRGGMGTVYAGVHVETGERAAIKSLALNLADDRSFRARFLSEIETLKQLQHPNIVQMIGDGEQDGHLFFVMELVDGKSLQDALQAGESFAWRDVIRIAVDVSAALKHAHDCGVIHRDLKPANLLQATDGTIKLTDFGIAKLFGATHRTADGSVVGTADYMSPEQADGKPVTNRSDLYSLGAVMFTLLARRTPFAGGSLPQVIHRLKYEEAPSVRRFSPETPEVLDELIAELLRKDPMDRIPTALVLANRLKAMDHALQLQESENVSPDLATTRVIPPELIGDSATLPPRPPGQPATRISPTHAEGKPSTPHAYAWNEETISTSPPAANDPEPTTPPLDALRLSPPAPPQNRFSTLEDYKRELQKKKEEVTTSSHGSTIGLAIAAVALVALIVWGLWPPSADSLYAKIRETTSAAGPADAIKEIESFTERFPNDPRFAEIEGLRMDAESGFLAKRLGFRKRRSNGHDLADFEEQWLDAFHLKKKDPDAARAKFESILEEHQNAETKSEELTTVLAASRHQLMRMREE